MNRFIKKITANFWVPKDKRPGWFIDAKWICGLLFVVVFATSLTSYSVLQLTDRERAVEMITGIIEDSLDSVEGNLQGRIAEYQQSLKDQKAEGATADTERKPSVIGQALKLFFPEQDILNMSAGDLKEGLLENLAVPLYEQGTSYVFTLLKGLDYATPIDNALNRIPIYSDETHDNLMAWFVTTLIIAMISLAGLVYFSWGWGKIFNAGLVIAFTAAPGFFGYGYAHKFIKDFIPDVAAEGSNIFINIFVVGLFETLEKNFQEITSFQTTWFWIGIALIAIAVGGKLFIVFRNKRQKMETEIRAEVKKDRERGKS